MNENKARVSYENKSKTKENKMLPTHRPPTSPGEILEEEFLKPMEMSQSKLADLIGVRPQTINMIVNGKRAITAETAVGFSNVFHNSPQFWMGLQTDLDLWNVIHGVKSQHQEEEQHAR